MAAWLLDANALLDYEGNPVGKKLRQATRRREHPWYLTTFGALEVLSVLARNRRKGVLTPHVHGLVVRQFEEDVSTTSGWVRLWHLRNKFYPRCRQMIDTHAVRAMLALSAPDSLHLLAALDLRDRHPGLHLVTSDAALANVARLEGLGVYDPTND